MEPITHALTMHHVNGTYRHLRGNGRGFDFSSNDYLGLSRCPKIKTKLIQALESGCPLGATGSRLLSGQTKYHERVESFLTQVFNVPAALIYGSGFMANLGVLSTFGSLEVTFFSDELNHASLVDGMKLTRSPKLIFRHNDLNHLHELLTKNSSPCKVIVSESVFSMDGDLAPLSELLKIAERFDAWLVIDEAHATGVFGTCGLGRLENSRSTGNKLISIHTGGKALGGQGAFVLSDQNFRNLMINRARSFIFSTALSPLSALQIEYAIQEVIRHPERGPALLQAAENFRRALPWQSNCVQSQSQIIPFIIGSNKKTIQIASDLQERGFDVRAIRSPAVPKGSERLRITIKSDHHPVTLENFLTALREIT